MAAKPGLPASQIEPDPIILGLTACKPEACEYVLTLASAFVRAECDLLRTQQEDVTDFVYDALVDVLAAANRGHCTDREELSQLVKSSILQNVRNHDDRNAGRVDIEHTLKTVDGELFDDFEEMTPPPRLIYNAQKDEAQNSIIRADILAVSSEMIGYLVRHPEKMYELNPRTFEELIAELLKDQGYSVELTGRGADGGVDIYATQKTGVGEVLLIADCKRYAPHRPVGVQIVRSLYGIGEHQRATIAMLATTSYFSVAAKEFHSTVRHRLSLQDYGDLVSLLARYGRRAGH